MGDSGLSLSCFLSFILFFLHFYLTFSSSFSSNFSSSPHLCAHDQSRSLLQFKESFSIDSYASWKGCKYPKTESWKDGTDCCLWDGVICDMKSGQVIELNLACSMLYGTFHSNNSLFSLLHLQKLDLSYNNFDSSPISSRFGHFSNLTHLNLSYSVFNGQVPSEISHLSKLVSLDLSWNDELTLEQISFDKLVQKLSKLRELHLSWVNMSLVVSTSSLMNLSSSLSSLKLSRCGLHGKFQLENSHLSNLVSLDLSDNYDLSLEQISFDNLIQNLSNLRELDLSEVNMSFIVPNSLTNLSSSSLSSLKLSSCGLHGKFPSRISHLSSLVSLVLSYNYGLSLEQISFDNIVQNSSKLRELDLSGINLPIIVPNSLMNLSSSSLSSLKLAQCGLYGKFPFRISYFSKLVSLDLSDNHGLSLEQSSLDNLVENSSKLRELDLSGINMSFIVPNSLMNLSSSLSFLSLHSCGLHGKFPSNIFLLPNLELLDLIDNEGLTGSFPSSNSSGVLQWLSLSNTRISVCLDNGFINNLKSLKFLYLRNCNIVRSNIALFGNLTQLIFLDLSANNFSGQIPSSLGNLVQLMHLSLSSNSFMGRIPDSFGTLTQIVDFDVSHNQLLGTIPTFLFALSSLMSLDLHNNLFTGNISEFQQSYSLIFLDLSNNHLHGPIPSSICKLKFLQFLDLSNNSLSGSVPQCLGNFSNSLSILDLGKNNLKGAVPVTFSQGSSLEYLYLNENDLAGEISSSICKLKLLQVLDLSNNSLSGSIPQCLGNFSNSLLFLRLGKNNLKGAIPATFSQGCSLEYLDLNGNELAGEISSSICKLKFLQLLDLSNNSLSGSIPQCLGNFSNSLSVLDLGKNNLKGTMPSTFSQGCGLEYLNLNGNELEGQIPSSIINCTQLGFLDLSNNKIEDTFPYFLERLPELQVLVLKSNKLHGHVKGPNSKDSFSKLQIFDISSNNLSGPLPTRYFNSLQAMIVSDQNMTYLGARNYYGYVYSIKVIWKGFELEFVKIQSTLRMLDFSNNNFTGEIPETIGNLKAVEQLNLSHNSLTGHIQSSLGSLTNLESLDLSSNLLTGRIPIELADLTFLGVLNLSHNHLEGRIPREKQFNTFGRGSFEGNSGLCGFPMPKECSSGETPPLPPSNFHEGDDSTLFEDGFGWKAVAMGYGFGFVFGVTIGYILLRTRKPVWLLKMVEVLWGLKVRRTKRNARRNGVRRN